jgi:hypothetical protein
MTTNHKKRNPGIASGIAILALLLMVAGCASTRLQRAWIAPDVGTLKIGRVVAIAFSNNPGRRRAMESSIADEIRKAAPEVEVIQSSTLVSDADLRNEEKARASLERAGFDAQLVMRVTDVNRTDVYVPGRTRVVPQYYRTFWGYYRYWVPIAYEPGYVERDRDVQVETALYSTAERGGLVYTAVSRTLNPSSAADLAEDVTSVVVKDLKEKRLFPTS